MSQTDFVLLVCIPKECALFALVIQHQDESTSQRNWKKTAPGLVWITFYVYVATPSLSKPIRPCRACQCHYTLPDNGFRCQIECFSLYISSKCFLHFYPCSCSWLLRNWETKCKLSNLTALRLFWVVFFSPSDTSNNSKTASYRSRTSCYISPGSDFFFFIDSLNTPPTVQECVCSVNYKTWLGLN